MSHPDPERLVLLALGEPDDAAAGHLASCAHCAAEVASLRAVADIGAESQEVRDLPAPPASVWARIEAAVERPSTVDVPILRPRRREWLRLAVTAVAATALGVAGTLGVGALRKEAAPTVVARATLEAFPNAPVGAGGEARVLGSGDGARLHLHVTGLPLSTGYYEVWLIDPVTMRMFSIGHLTDSGDVLLPLNSTVDLRQYRVVDVSAEEYDNVQTHSGRSLLRGTLTN
ncbi:hypothetical protein Val02_25500 [Virgisporangium aliadipatigenens]|uniref:Anti-sigma K factor RskA C-terminal domain-containing protein n=1 Tax=Virgisporangium aliadipatigenens TaxID=741659 RepID=A0A8J3YI46_9ACTN|nr:anti-sigma factor [Virgisporangium aliadipatigenens]GIJ45664.1 hypothetical protein Val02_25500 [Virgisporangium aliadipatigenens]